MLSLDEDVPEGLAAIAAESEYVVLASVESIEAGHRFYGGDPEDISATSYEDVTVNLKVIEVHKGDPPASLAVRWPAYVASSESSSDRVGALRVQGVILNEQRHSGRYLWFLKNYPEPFGLSPVTMSSALMEVNPAGVVTGQVSVQFEDQRGRPLGDVLYEAGLIDR